MKKRTIFALGFFDGVHLGHGMVLDLCQHLAENAGAETAAITFDRHPLSLFSPTPPALINTTEDRCWLLQTWACIDHLLVLPVNAEVMGLPWQDFLENLIREGAVGFVCGYDFRFGYKGEGTAEKLAAFAKERNMPCYIVEEQTLDGKKISSTRIRTLIEAGDVENANRLLGHWHMFTGKVVHGQHLGRTLGVPTANLQLPEELVKPAFGVYACSACVDGNYYVAVTNVGTRPTVDGQDVTVEPWILDFEGDLYGKKITLFFRKFLRPEQKFDTLDKLKKQILQDAEDARRVINGTY